MPGTKKSLSALLKQDSTLVEIHPNQDCALLRMKRPSSSSLLTETCDDSLLSALQRHVARRHISMSSALHVAVGVSLVVPPSAPSELNRSSVLRINHLGSGNFCEVFKVELTVGSAGLKIPAACKTLKQVRSDQSFSRFHTVFIPSPSRCLLLCVLFGPPSKCPPSPQTKLPCTARTFAFMDDQRVL